MKIVSDFITFLGRFVWSDVLVYLCLLTGIYLSVRLRFVQIRLWKRMGKLIVKKPDKKAGITPFQSFVTTVGARVGMGNIAGVAAALFYGGPGAVFWMWIIALFGASLAFAESTLAQQYKIYDNGQYLGGPAYYMERGMKCRALAVIFSAAVIIGPGMLMTGPQVQSVSSTFFHTFGINRTVTGVICMVLICIVIFGGIKRIGKTAEILTPFMCLFYVGMAAAVILINIRKLPGILLLIVQSAFGLKPAFSGILGAALAMGVKRGIYSNEAGQGNGAMISAAAQCSHPAEQGLIQAASVYISTMVICTASALIMLLTGFYNVADSQGNLLFSGIPSVEYGILWVQEALKHCLGNWAASALAIVIVLFVFTSLMTYYYMAEASVKYLFRKKSDVIKKSAVYAMRMIFAVSVFLGALFTSDVAWSMGDIGAGLMVWSNLAALIVLSGEVVELLKKYEKEEKRTVFMDSEK